MSANSQRDIRLFKVKVTSEEHFMASYQFYRKRLGVSRTRLTFPRQPHARLIYGGAAVWYQGSVSPLLMNPGINNNINIATL